MKNFNFARDALKHIIKENEIKEIYLPYYLCDVIRHAVVEVNCKPVFYHVDDEFMPACEFPKESYILYPNYFGICDNNVEKLVQIYPKLIVDNAHAFFAEPEGFATIYSPHKWLNGGKRKEFDKYHEIYFRTNQLNINISENAVPFCYPYLAATVEEADILVRKLKKEGKIIYRYWNHLPESYNEYKFYSRLVPIPL